MFFAILMEIPIGTLIIKISFKKYTMKQLISHNCTQKIGLAVNKEPKLVYDHKLILGYIYRKTKF